MTTLHRLVVSWAGPSVKGLAVNVLHWDGSDNAAPPVAAVLSAYQTFAAACAPANTVITVPGTGDSIDDTTGALTGVWTASGGGQTTASSVAEAPAGVGACVTWQTGGIVNGRRLRGRTFLVPLHNQMYASDGTFTPSGVLAIAQFGTSMLAAGPLAVWHRPTTPGGSDGNSYGAVGVRVTDKVAVLRSRRD